MKSENNNHEDEKEISKLRLFLKLFRQSSGYKALIKLSLYFLMCFIIIIVVAVAGGGEVDDDGSKTDSNETTDVVPTKSYRDIINELLTSDKKFSYVVTNNSDTFYITYDYKDNVESGLFEGANIPLKKFIIRDNLVYEVVLNEEKENEGLFLALKIDYININSLVELLTNNKGFKMLESDATIYKYDIDGVSIDVCVKDESIERIEINDIDTKYTIDIK